MSDAIDSSGNVFADLGFGEPEATSRKIRTDLLIALRDYVKSQGWRQVEIGEKLGIAQSRVSYLMNVRSDKFSIDMLVNLLTMLGFEIDFKVRKPRKPAELVPPQPRRIARRNERVVT